MAAPAVAVELADNFRVLLPLPGAAMLVGAKLAVTPAGSPLADNAIPELNPFPPAVVKVIETDPPRATLAVVTLDDNVKLPITVRLRVRVLVTPPPTAVTVRVEAPPAAVEVAESVKVLLPLPGAAMVLGAKLAVTPLGAPLADNLIAELNPPTLVVVKVRDFEPPGATLALVPFDVSVKLLEDCKTVRLNARVLSVPPPTAPSVKLDTPGGAVEATESVKMLLPFPGAGILVLVKLAVTPLGSPLIDK